MEPPSAAANAIIKEREGKGVSSGRVVRLQMPIRFFIVEYSIFNLVGLHL